MSERYMIALSLLAASVAAAPTVRTGAGLVVGTRLDGANQFLGLPFAHSKRFEPPVDFTGTYNGTRHATAFGPACMQVGGQDNVTYGSEDCLVGNIWQPANAKPGDRLPVLAFIFGGSWQFGETEPYNGSALAAKHNVIYAALAYRTGPIGFMAFKEDVATNRTTGNWGMLDMQSGLRWLRREVGYFGGDPARITIHGQSSGGQAVELHHVMPASAGLLSGIISESGGLSASPLEAGLAATQKAVEAAGCKGAAEGEKACMQAAPPVAITAQTYGGHFGPLVDGVTIPDDPSALLRRGAINPGVGFLAGAQTNDSNRELFPAYEDAHGQLRPMTALEYRAAVAGMVGKPHLDEVLAVYPAVSKAEGDTRANVVSLGRIASDQMLCRASQRLRAFHKATGRPAFLYRFNYYYQSNRQCTAEPNYHAPLLGAVHEDEMTFVMGQPIFMFDGSCCGVYGAHAGSSEACAAKRECTACFAPHRFGSAGYQPYFNEKELAFSELVGRFWTNFASSQDPNVRHDFDAASGRLVDASQEDAHWPDVSTGKNIVLDADLDGHAAAEGTLYGDDRVCALWAKIDAAPAAVEQA